MAANIRKKTRRKTVGECYRCVLPAGKCSKKTADHSPDRVSLLHKGGESHMTQRVRKPHRRTFLRPPGNSPSRWHLTRGFLLCSQGIIHHFLQKVNREMQNFRYLVSKIVVYSANGTKASPRGRLWVRKQHFYRIQPVKNTSILWCFAV